MNKRRFLFSLLAPVALLLFPLALEAAAADPAVGRWQWGTSNHEFFLHSDGIASERGRSGKWTCLKPGQTPRKYEISWDNGKFIDTLYLVKGGKEMEGENQYGKKLRARRLPL